MLDRLVPAVAEYATDWFALAHDLDRIERVRGVGAPEAAILYCARVLEALAADALIAIDLQPSSNLFANLDTLQCLNLIPAATRYWAHALRRMGNLVRHIGCRIVSNDVELAVIFVERWLNWFFRGFRYGPRLAELTVDGVPLGLGGDKNLRVLIESLESDDADLLAILRQLDLDACGRLPDSPALIAVLTELLLDRGEHAAAETLLQAALVRFPNDLRLRQLQGLHLSRVGRLQEAMDWLEPLYKQHRDDDETAGIMAGVYKRAWFADPLRRDRLESSHHAYRHAWEKSKEMNSYLGINAATTSLWLGRPSESRETAEAVRDLLHSQSAALAKFSTDEALAFNFWQHMTLVEADLLLGSPAVAQDRFRRILEYYGDRQRANIEVARKQFHAILPALGLSLRETELFGPPGTGS